MDDATPALQAEGLTKRFGAKTAVDSLSLRLAPGSVTGFLGPNGAGKSTTLRMIAGLLRPTVGTVEIFGRPASEAAARRRLGYLPADAGFDPRLSGVENLDILASLRGAYGSVDRELIADRLNFDRGDASRPVKQLSGGMRQKLGLIAALQHRPHFVVLDEPANRLDPLVHRAFCELVRGIADAGRTVLLSSHVLGEVDEVCDQIALIRDGRLIRLTDIAEIRHQAQRRVTITYSAPHPSPDLLTSPTVAGNVVTGRIPSGRPDLVRTLLTDSDITDIEIEAPSLEDLFLDLYTGKTST